MNQIVVTTEDQDLRAAPHSMLGIRALFAEGADEDIEPAAPLASTGLVGSQTCTSRCEPRTPGH